MMHVTHSKKLDATMKRGAFIFCDLVLIFNATAEKIKFILG